METHRTDDPSALEPDGLSRREALLRIGAGGLAVALAAQGTETAHAQEATPTAVAHVGDVSGMPEGVNLIPLGDFPVHDLPTEPFMIRMMRVTLEPGAVIPPAAVPYPAAAYIEAGEGVICPEGGEGRWLYGPDGELLDWGTMDMVFPVGTWCYTPPNTADGLRNEREDQPAVLGIGHDPPTEEGSS